MQAVQQGGAANLEQNLPNLAYLAKNGGIRTEILIFLRNLFFLLLQKCHLGTEFAFFFFFWVVFVYKRLSSGFFCMCLIGIIPQAAVPNANFFTKQSGCFQPKSSQIFFFFFFSFPREKSVVFQRKNVFWPGAGSAALSPAAGPRCCFVLLIVSFWVSLGKTGFFFSPLLNEPCVHGWRMGWGLKGTIFH